VKSVIIFGGSGTIGQAISKRLRKEGYGTIIADVIHPTKSSCDFSMVICQEKFGALDVVINCQGVYKVEKIENTESYDFDKIIDVNLKSIFLVYKNAIPIMKWQKRGYLIAISSTAGVRGKRGQSAYCASKFGVVGLCDALFDELRETGVRVTTIAPASVDTPLLNNNVKLTESEMEKILKPTDVAKAVSDILSSDTRVRQKMIVLDIDIEIDKLKKKKY
jgi:3-oxoacyl-[acyl-carrier protein] reductase